MAKLTALSLIAVSRGVLYPIVIPSSFPETTTYTVEPESHFYVSADIPEAIVENISMEMIVHG